VKTKLKVMIAGKEEIVEADSVPFATESEQFNVYSPNVPEDHPLYGAHVKVRVVVKGISYYGKDELGNPRILVQSDTIVGVE